MQAGVFRVMVYHGPSRPKDPSVLLSYNIIITTYNIVGIESNSLTTDIQELREPAKKGRTASSTALFQLHWKRIVLDKGHNIRNPKSQRSIGCSSLSADHRWVLTGTPVQNKLEDQGMQRLNYGIATLLLQRTKEELSMAGVSHLKLPNKVTKLHQTQLNEKEKVIHDILFSQGRAVFSKYLWRSSDRQ